MDDTILLSRAGSAAPADELEKAKSILRGNRREGLAALNELFRCGSIPNPPPHGPYDGELVAVDLAAGVNQVVTWLTWLWMPWKGKYLMASKSRGDNIFGLGSRFVMKLMFPLYQGFQDYDSSRFRAFEFKTSIAPGKVDSDRQVFRIDYDMPENPGLSIRRIIDEVVQIPGGIYLGKIHFKWWWGDWQMIGYFALRKPRISVTV